MTETIRLVDYYYIEAPDKPGEAVRILDQLRHAGVFLLAFSGFPKGRRAQLDIVPANAPAFRAAASLTLATCMWRATRGDGFGTGMSFNSVAVNHKNSTPRLRAAIRNPGSSFLASMVARAFRDRRDNLSCSKVFLMNASNSSPDRPL